MGTYYINEAAFELPDVEFRDETVHILRAKVGDEADLNVLVFRARLSEPRSLRELAASHKDEERRTLAGFSLLSEADIDVAGAAAIATAFRFRNEKTIVYQRNTHFLLGERHHLLVAVNAPIEHREACDRTMDHVLSTLQLRTD